MTPVLLVPDAVLIGTDIKTGLALLIQDGAISAVDRPQPLAREYPDAERVALAQQLLMPGSINAHQHGRGISSLQHGGQVG